MQLFFCSLEDAQRGPVRHKETFTPRSWGVLTQATHACKNAKLKLRICF